MTNSIHINIRITVSPSHQFLNNIIMFAREPISLGLLHSIHFMSTNATTSTNGFHKYRERDLTFIYSLLKFIKVMISQRSRNTFLSEIFEHLIFVKTTTSSNLICRTKRQHTSLQEFFTIRRENLNLRIYESGYSLYISFFTDIKHRINILGIIDTRNNIFVCRKVQCRGC